jgi:hypothetical protein
MTPAHRTTATVLFLLFFLSGFCSLLYQVVWVRMAFAHFGVITPVLSVVLSVFMLGLGVGSVFGGRLAREWDRSRQTSLAVLYGFCELIIGVGAFAVPVLFALGDEALLRAGETSSVGYLVLFRGLDSALVRYDGRDVPVDDGLRPADAVGGGRQLQLPVSGKCHRSHDRSRPHRSGSGGGAGVPQDDRDSRRRKLFDSACQFFARAFGSSPSTIRDFRCASVGGYWSQPLARNHIVHNRIRVFGDGGGLDESIHIRSKDDHLFVRGSVDDLLVGDLDGVVSLQISSSAQSAHFYGMGAGLGGPGCARSDYSW